MTDFLDKLLKIKCKILIGDRQKIEFIKNKNNWNVITL